MRKVNAVHVVPGDEMNSGWGAAVEVMPFHDVVVICWLVDGTGREWSQCYSPDALFWLKDKP